MRIEAAVDDAAGTLDIAALLERTSERMRTAENQSPAQLLDTLRSSLASEIGVFWSRYLLKALRLRAVILRSCDDVREVSS